MGKDDEKAGREKLGTTLYRAMIPAANGEPACGSTARTLGVRLEVDIAVDACGQVYPGTGGMSVAPDSPTHLPRHRRTPEFGGTGKDPLWCIQEAYLGPMLRYLPDRVSRPQHGVIESAIPMTFDAYQQALEATSRYWTRISL
jgi:hypothetical protein